MQKTFDELTNAIATHRAIMAKILTEHAEKKRRNLEWFKPEIAEAQNANLCAYTRARIANWDEILSGAFKNALHMMRTELDQRAKAPADRDLIENLRMMQEFNIQMTPDDLRAYVKVADGNLAALFCIDALARENGCSLYDRGIGNFQRDIDDLEALSKIPMLIAPDECMQAALEVFPRGTTEADVKKNTEEMDEFAAERIPLLQKVWTSKIEPTVIMNH